MADIGPLLGSRIHSQLEKEVVPSLDSALRMAGGNEVQCLTANHPHLHAASFLVSLLQQRTYPHLFLLLSLSSMIPSHFIIYLKEKLRMPSKVNRAAVDSVLVALC